MFKGEKVNLRALEAEDLEKLYSWENDFSNWHVSGTTAPFSRFVLEQYLASAHEDIFVNKQLRLIIEIASENGKSEAIGCIDMFEFEPKHKRAGVGILIGEKHLRNTGYGFDALTCFTRFAFAAYNLHQLFCNVAADNHSSIALFMKAGFKITATRNEWLLKDDQWVDEHLLQYFNEK